MAKVRVNARDFSNFSALESGEYFFYKNELYLKVTVNTAYCFSSSAFIYFDCADTVEWIDDSKIVITIE